MYTRNAVVVLFAPGRFAIQVWADLEFRATTLIGQMLAQLIEASPCLKINRIILIS